MPKDTKEIKKSGNRPIMKLSQARILIFLSQADLPFCYKTNISARLRMDYCYLHLQVKQMEAEGWVISENKRGKRYIRLTELGSSLIETAKRRVV